MKEKSIVEIFQNKISPQSNRIAIGFIEDEKINFLEQKKYHQLVTKTSLAFLNLGIKKAQKVAILSSSRIEWHLCDLALMHIGAIVVPIDTQASLLEIENILNIIEVDYLIIENQEQLNKIFHKLSQKNFNKLECIIAFDELNLANKLPLKNLNWDDFLNSIDESNSISIKSELDNRLSLLDKDDIITILYKSDSKNNLQGLSLSHWNILSSLNFFKNKLDNEINIEDRSLLCLPLTHSLGRFHSLFHLVQDHQIVYASKSQNLVNDLKLVKPSFIMGDAQLFENFYKEVLEHIINDNKIKNKFFSWASKTSREYFEKFDQDLSPTLLSIIKRQVSYSLVFENIFNLLGGKISFLISSGEFNKETFNFFRELGITILETLSLDETFGPCLCNPLSRQIPGTVGVPVGEVEIKISNNGELLIRSQSLFSGYYKNKELTQQKINDGWYNTSTFAHLDDEGHVIIQH